MLVWSNFPFQNVLSYANAFLGRELSQLMSDCLSCAFDLAFRLVSHPSQLGFSTRPDSLSLSFDLSRVTFLYFGHFSIEGRKTSLDFSKFRQRLITFLPGPFQLSLYRLTSCSQAFLYRSAKTSMQVERTQYEQKKIDKLPQLETRIIPPGSATLRSLQQYEQIENMK